MLSALAFLMLSMNEIMLNCVHGHRFFFFPFIQINAALFRIKFPRVHISNYKED